MIKINQVLTEFRIPAGEQKLVYQFKGFTASQMDELHAMLHRAGIVTTPDFNKRTITTYSNRDAMKLKKNKTIQRFIKSKGGKQIKEGTCGYGVNGKLGEEPAGPNLRKKIKDISKDKNESVGSRGYDGRDWFWPHDFRHYLRDASPAQRKKIHDAWLKIGVPVKKTGLKISDRYLQPKKNQMKKAWTIVRKVVAPKELGMPIPESVNEAKYKGYDYKRQNRKDGLPLIVPALQKTFSNMKDLKKYIDKHGTMESVNEAMSEPQRFKVYNSLKKGDIVSIKYDSSIQKGTKYIPYVVTKGKTKLMKGKIERIILKNPSNPRFKAYLYNRDGDVSLALGDMAASIVDMKKGKVKESVFDLDEACQKGYMTHPTRKTKIMFGKRYRNCVKKEGVDTTMTMEQAGRIMDNLCVNCGDFANENLRKWFKDRWVNIGKKKKGGGHPPCGTSGKKRGYAKCVPASKAASMTKKQKASATRRKRAAQNKKGRGGTSSLKGGGKKPIYVSTKPKK